VRLRQIVLLTMDDGYLSGALKMDCAAIYDGVTE
jgi:hypothetical protein